MLTLMMKDLKTKSTVLSKLSQLQSYEPYWSAVIKTHRDGTSSNSAYHNTC